MKRLIKLGGFGLLLVCVYVALSQIDRPTPKFMPGFDLPHARPGRPKVQVAQVPGKPLIVNFFASWCNICSEEEPYLKQLANVLAEFQGEVIGVASRDSRGALYSSGKLDERPYRVGLDRSGEVSAAFGIDGVPQTLLIRADGKVLYHVRGKLRPIHLQYIAEQLSRSQEDFAL